MPSQPPGGDERHSVITLGTEIQTRLREHGSDPSLRRRGRGLLPRFRAPKRGFPMFRIWLRTIAPRGPMVAQAAANLGRWRADGNSAENAASRSDRDICLNLLGNLWWTHLDLNQGPLACEASALTVLSYASTERRIIVPSARPRKPIGWLLNPDRSATRETAPRSKPGNAASTGHRIRTIFDLWIKVGSRTALALRRLRYALLKCFASGSVADFENDPSSV